MKFLERAEVQYNATCRDEGLNILNAKKHVSTFDEVLKKEDRLARLTLSFYAYKNLFVKIQKMVVCYNMRWNLMVLAMLFDQLMNWFRLQIQLLS